MTWKELKGFCNSLQESDLNKPVILWREDEAINDISAERLEEDHYVSVENRENGCFPESEKGCLEDELFEKVYDKGYPLLHENF